MPQPGSERRGNENVPPANQAQPVCRKSRPVSFMRKNQSMNMVTAHVRAEIESNLAQSTFSQWLMIHFVEFAFISQVQIRVLS